MRLGGACPRLVISVLTAALIVSAGCAAKPPPRPHLEAMVKTLGTVPYPRIAMFWSPVRGGDSLASYARHDLILLGAWKLGLESDRQPPGLADGFTAESVEKAKHTLAELRRLNPHAVIVSEINFYEYSDRWLPEDHPWWLRVNGERQQFWPGTHRMDWNNTEFRAHVVRQTQALQSTGIDGVFYDNLRSDEPEPWKAFMRELRAAVGDDFLILVNAGYDFDGFDWLLPSINGIMYESGWSHARTEWEACIKAMRHNETLLRTPRISAIERFEDIRDYAGWPGRSDRNALPPRDSAARRWSLCYTLIVGDYYYLFSDSTSHRHDWYPEYDVKLGLPVGEGTRVNAHVWQRKYEKAQVIANLPGAEAPFTARLDQPARDAFTGETGTKFAIPPGDGRILVTIP
jgi:hypothetical protein